MQSASRNIILALICGVVLGACGGDNSPTIHQSMHSESTKLQPSRKALASDYQTAVQALYISYFGRPADPTGLANFGAALLSANAPPDIEGLNNAYATSPAVRALVDSFGTSAESAALYGKSSATAIVTAIFQNVLGRTPASAGLSFWADAISKGTVTQGDAALSIMAGALANTSAQGLLDTQLINNRLAAATYFTAEISTQNAVSAYSGATAAASARNFLSGVAASSSAASYDANAAVTVSALFGNLPNLSPFAGNFGGPGNIDGIGRAARFNFALPGGIATDSMGNVYVVDVYRGFNFLDGIAYDVTNASIRKISPGGVVTTLIAPSTNLLTTCGSPACMPSIALDAANNLYVTNPSQNTILKITAAGTISTFAGSPNASKGGVNGVGTSASFFAPTGIAVDIGGNVYVADTFDCDIRKITPAGVVTTLAGTGGSGYADGTGTAAVFNAPQGIAVDTVGNVFVADTYNGVIRKITPAGLVSTIAGAAGAFGSSDGIGVAARFGKPTALVLDSGGNIYVTDAGFNTVRKITASGMVSTLAGTPGVTGADDGLGGAATFNDPTGIAVDRQGNVFVEDTGNNTIRVITPAGLVSTFAGKTAVTGQADGVGAGASFDGPTSVASDGAGNVYVADTVNNVIRRITSAGIVTTFAGTAGVTGHADGTASAASFKGLAGIATDMAGNVYVSDSGNNAIRMITPAGVVSTICGQAGVAGSANGSAAAATFSRPQGIAIDANGNIYLADDGNQLIRKITKAGVVSTLAGSLYGYGHADGSGSAAKFLAMGGMAVDPNGNIYLSEIGTDSLIRKITPDGMVTTLAGTSGHNGYADGTGAAAKFNNPRSITTDSAGNIYVADTDNNMVRKVTPAGVVTTVIGAPGQVGVAGGVLPGRLISPQGVTMNGKLLYITTSNGVVVAKNLP